MRMWMGLCADYLYREVVRSIPLDRPPTDEERTTARRALERAEALTPPEGFLAGERISLADLYVAPSFDNRAGKAPELLDGLPATEAWMQRMRARPSFRGQTVYAPA